MYRHIHLIYLIIYLFSFLLFFCILTVSVFQIPEALKRKHRN